jgi:hypothetical protein
MSSNNAPERAAGEAAERVAEKPAERVAGEAAEMAASAVNITPRQAAPDLHAALREVTEVADARTRTGPRYPAVLAARGTP